MGREENKNGVLTLWHSWYIFFLKYGLTNFYIFFFQRQSNVPQQQSHHHHQQQSQHQESSSRSNSKSNPYQSQLYDSWRTEWNAPYYDQYRSGPSGASSSAEAVNHSGGGRSAYMTKGGRRLSYEDDFWYKLKKLKLKLATTRTLTNKSIQCKFETKKNS